jgi:ATP-binding cassette subfamily C (CFTR/MRP) protein 4
VTHQIQFLKDAHKIMVLKDGKCVALGTFKELNDAGINFMSYLAETKSHDPKHDHKTEQASFGRKRAVSFTPSIASIASVGSLEHEGLPDHLDEEEPALKKETKMSGSIDSSVYWEYSKAGAGPFLLFVTFSSIIISQALYQGSDFWLTIW